MRYPYKFAHEEEYKGLNVQFLCENDQISTEESPLTASVKLQRAAEGGGVVRLWVRHHEASALSVAIGDSQGTHVIMFDVTDPENPTLAGADQVAMDDETFRHLDRLFGTEGAAARIRSREIKNNSQELKQVVQSLRSVLFTDPKDDEAEEDTMMPPAL
jgi:hypothetical protein